MPKPKIKLYVDKLIEAIVEAVDCLSLEVVKGKNFRKVCSTDLVLHVHPKKRFQTIITIKLQLFDVGGFKVEVKPILCRTELDIFIIEGRPISFDDDAQIKTLLQQITLMCEKSLLLHARKQWVGEDAPKT